MYIKFRQGWTDLFDGYVDIQFFRIIWGIDEEDRSKYFNSEITILNFSLQIEFPINKIGKKRRK